MLFMPKRLRLISAPDISARDILARTFHQRDFLVRGHFGTRKFWHEKISAWVYFGTMDVSAQGPYGTGTFGHMDVLAHVHFGIVQSNIDISSQVPLCQNVHVLKYFCVKMSQCCNVSVPKRPWCWKVLMPKCSCAEMSLAQMSGAKISPSPQNG